MDDKELRKEHTKPERARHESLADVLFAPGWKSDLLCSAVFAVCMAIVLIGLLILIE